MPLVTVDGFSEKSGIEFLPVDNVGESDSSIAVDIPNDVDPVGMRDQFHRIHTIRIEFPSSADGRGFSLARQLRNLGYEGRIRAQGPLISDQFRYALLIVTIVMPLALGMLSAIGINYPVRQNALLSTKMFITKR